MSGKDLCIIGMAGLVLMYISTLMQWHITAFIIGVVVLINAAFFALYQLTRVGGR